MSGTRRVIRLQWLVGSISSSPQLLSEGVCAAGAECIPCYYSSSSTEARPLNNDVEEIGSSLDAFDIYVCERQDYREGGRGREGRGEGSLVLVAYSPNI